MTLAVFGVLCLAAPPAVLASGHGEQTLHCLAHAVQVGHGVYMARGGMDHAEHGKLPAKHQGGCCGLFCVSAILLQAHTVAEPAFLPPALTPVPDIIVSGLAPEQPNRPPILVLSV